MNRIVYWSRYFSTSREVRFVPLLAIVHDVISFKQVIQGKHPAFIVLAVSNYEAMLTMIGGVSSPSLSHPPCDCLLFCRPPGICREGYKGKNLKIFIELCHNTGPSSFRFGLQAGILKPIQS